MKLLLLTFVSALLVLIYGQDCNIVYETLRHLERRARNYAIAENEPLVFDENLVHKWYNVGKYNMPTNSASLTIGICGTYYPIWMRGLVPAEEEGAVIRTACIVSFQSYCSAEKTIKVRNCGAHMIYELEPTTQTSAYCFDNLPEMPDIKPAPGFKPASAEVKHKLVFVDGVSQVGSLPIKIPKLIFSCKFDESNMESLFYTITWYVNEAILPNKGPVLYTNIKDTDLNEDELTREGYKLGITIKCSVRASITIDGFPGNMTVSSGFWIGIKVLNPTLNMTQGGTGEIVLQNTVPFGCIAYAVTLPCLVNVEMYDQHDSYDCQSSSISVRKSDRCSTTIRGSTFEEAKQGIFFYEETNMTITTKDIDDVNDYRNLFILRLKTSNNERINSIVQDSYLEDITVTVRKVNDWILKRCYSHIDPHMMSFDQRLYENQNLGEFVMYRHSQFKQEVQMKTYSCGSGVTCACAASINAGGELFIINVCTKPSLIRHASCKEKLMSIRRINEYIYEIYMPLGTMVVIEIKNWPTHFSSLNIDILPSVKDVRNTMGLCGILNKYEDDDFTTPLGIREPIYRNNEFSNSWKIDQSKSFLNPLNHNPDYWEDIFYLCVCPVALNTTTTPGTASGSNRHPLCSPSVYQGCTKKKEFKGTEYNDCNVISKRSLVSHAKEIQRILSKEVINDEALFQLHSVSKRSLKNYTVDEAKSTCQEMFNRSIVAISFDSLFNNTMSKESAIHDCALDLATTGDMQLVDVHISSYVAETERNIRRDSVFRINHSEEVHNFYSHACINNCNGHGECINGTCSCHEPYIEEDCSISKEDPPVVLDTYSGGLCLKNNDTCCGRLPIYGYRFVSGTTIQKTELFQVYDSGEMEIVETTVNDLQILNAFEADMDVPCHPKRRRSTDFENRTILLASGVRVSLSNDGMIYGPAQSFYTYDAQCQGYENTTNGYTFYILDGTCYINGICYSEGEKDPADDCKQCLPGTDQYFFTGECSSTERKLPTSSEETVIIASVVSVLAVIICIVSILLVFKLCFRKDKRIRDVRMKTTVQVLIHEQGTNCATDKLNDRTMTPGSVSMTFN